MAATAQDMELIDRILLVSIDPSRLYESTVDATVLVRESTLFAAKSPLDDDDEKDDEEEEEDDEDFEDNNLEEDDDEFEDEEEDDEEEDDEEDEDTDDDPKPLRVKTRL